MSDGASLDRVIVVPRNGYVNRLQAWASAHILAEQLDTPLDVMWEPETPAPADPSVLFAQSLVSRSFVSRERLDSMLGGPHESLPRHLTVLPDRRLIVLAGHDRGEQAFMPDLRESLAHPCRPSTLLIVAGGKFHLPGPVDFASQRHDFYRHIEWSTSVGDAVDHNLTGHEDFVALHVRQTDRSREAPSAAAIREALRSIVSRFPQRSLFIAADTTEGREAWTARARDLEFEPWHAAHVDLDRTRGAAAVPAMVDWRLLGRARAVVFTAASSFGEEAAVATGHLEDCIPLAASPSLQRWRAVRAYGEAAVTYPRRHDWWSRRKA